MLNKYSKHGFTLIELLVVVLIIGILSAIALPQYRKAVTRAKNREAILAMRAIGQGIEMYNLENGALPTEKSSDFSILSIEPPASKHWMYLYFCPQGKLCYITANSKESREEVGDIEYWLYGKTDVQGHLQPGVYVNESELTAHTSYTDPDTHITTSTSSSESRPASAEICALAAGRMDPEKGCIIE